MGRYEFWISNDSGDSRTLLNPPEAPNLAFFDYIRSTRGIGYLHFGLPLTDWENLWPAGFKPDQIIEVWRSPASGFEMRREGKFFLRKERVYTRDDNVEIIELWSRSPLDLLNRRYVIQPAETGYTVKNDNIDDMMKDIVREQMLFGYAADQDGVVDASRAWPQGEFSVEDEHSLGPVIPRNFVDLNVLDILKGLRDLSFQKNLQDSADRKIYFDIVDGSTLNWNEIFILEEAEAYSPILDEGGDELLDEQSLAATTEKKVQFQFQTFADLRGQDRTGGVVFSVENGNLTEPSYTKNHLEEINTVIVRGQGRGENRVTAVVQDVDAAQTSRWNRIEGTESAASQTDEDMLEEVGISNLWENRREEELDVTFLDTPGSFDQPRSLYGIDWDLGDLLPVQYANKTFEVEVAIVYISIGEDGVESVEGMNHVGE